jgi:hypothetical protein
MFTAASPVGSVPNAAGGADAGVSAFLAGVVTFSANLTLNLSSGSTPGARVRRIDIRASYLKVDVRGTNNIDVTAG